MFYSHAILARKSPLGTVWIAAHLARKIKKPQIDDIHIPSYAESIMFPEVPIALRVSGHLLLGIVRIYSWKVKYLFEDCNRMLTTIRTAFASVQVDLPLEADFAPFEAITLPPTLSLDDFNLGDENFQIDGPDNHQKTPDQITLTDEEQYVTVDLDDGDFRVEPSVVGLPSFMEPEPIEEATFPPFDDGLGESNKPNDEISSPPGNLPVNPNNENQSDAAQGSPERMREASQEGPDLSFTKSIFGNDDPMEVNKDSSLFVQNKVITPPTVDSSSPGEQMPERNVPNMRTPTTYDASEDLAPQTFVFNNNDDQLDIPRLASTPGGLSSACTGATGFGSVSTRTRAVAQFFKDHVSSNSNSSTEQPRKFSLNRILEGQVRKQAAGTFFETMVLKSYDYIDAQQLEPYGDIEISVKPSLTAAKL
ncbi:hypothetical protein ACP4OV_011579 [Aristida adscensionis]